MLNIHEKPIFNDDFIDTPTFFQGDMDGWFDDYEPEEEEEEEEELMYLDGYPDELIPEHAFTDGQEDSHYVYEDH